MAPVPGGTEIRTRRGTCDVRLLLVLLLGGALAAVLFFDVRVLQQGTAAHVVSQQNHPEHVAPHVLSPVPAATARSTFQPSEHWGADWVIVITNYQRDLDWLKKLPYHLGLKVVVYIKQDEKVHRTCDQLPQEVKPHVALCREMKNAHGREAHTMAAFFVEFYYNLPRMMMFLQVLALDYAA